MRRKIVAGNWKMNNDQNESNILINAVIEKNSENSSCNIYVSPSFPFLKDAVLTCSKSNIKVLSQNVSHLTNGALTGDVSCTMLKSIGINSVIIGHSERRTIFGESDDILLKKLKICLENNLEVFFCIGEEIEARNNNKHFSVIENQLNETVFMLEKIDPKNLVIAYEPVWAIGTGLTASPEQAQEMHKFIRQKFTEKFSESISSNLSIIYGGSVKPSSAKNIFNQPDVDGGLIGGASLNANDFSDIINSI